MYVKIYPFPQYEFESKQFNHFLLIFQNSNNWRQRENKRKKGKSEMSNTNNDESQSSASGFMMRRIASIEIKPNVSLRGSTFSFTAPNFPQIETPMSSPRKSSSRMCCIFFCLFAFYVVNDCIILIVLFRTSHFERCNFHFSECSEIQHEIIIIIILFLSF